jgi:hypothetical protein
MQYCNECGAKLEARWERLSPLLVRDLVKMYMRVHEKNENSVSPSKELHLSATEYNNFQKLRFHGMVAHVPNVPGNWLLTHRAAQFLSGQIKVPRSVKIFRNRIQAHSPEMVNLKNVVADQPFLDMKENFFYEQEEFLPDKQPITQKIGLTFNEERQVYVQN